MTALAVLKRGSLDPVSAIDRPRAARHGLLSFPPFHLDFVEERLWKGERELLLRRKPFAILRYMALHPRRLVTYAEVTEAVWGKVAISESLLRTHVRDLRQSLGEPVIETVLGRGYRFVAELNRVDDEESGARLGESTSPPESGVSLVSAAEPACEGPTVDVLEGGSGASHDAILKQLADLLAASSPNATVFVIVRDPRAPV